MIRTRRLRRTKNLRALLADVSVSIDDLVYPLFIEEGEGIKTEIKSMPNQYRFSIDMLKEELDEIEELGIKAVLLFGIPKEKDEAGSQAKASHGIVQEATRFIKDYKPEMLVITDVCMCEYTSHGHCGFLDSHGHVINDTSAYNMAEIALSQARAGADIVAPSDMMDGRVGEIRALLDQNGFEHIPIMSYGVKYSSAYYGPFRDAADSAPAFGDRKTYQMDYRRTREYRREVEADLAEGADFIIVKPALSYLDIVKDIRGRYDVPVVVYNVSAEYSMVKAASSNGWIDEEAIVMEQMHSFKRAGADLIITYWAKDIARLIK